MDSQILGLNLTRSKGRANQFENSVWLVWEIIVLSKHFNNIPFSPSFWLITRIILIHEPFQQKDAIFHIFTIFYSFFSIVIVINRYFILRAQHNWCRQHFRPQSSSGTMKLKSISTWEMFSYQQKQCFKKPIVPGIFSLRFHHK